MIKKLKIEYVLLLALIFVGLFFRIKGISTDHSFWSDEAYVAELSRDLLEGQRSFSEVMNLYNYQRLHVLITSFSFLLFGYSEFAARLPSVFFGIIGIGWAYFLAKKLSNVYGGMIAGFVYAFSQMNLSYSTQAKSYAGLELMFLIIMYLLLQLHTKSTKKLHIAIILLIILATFYHFLGILLLIPYIILLFTYNQKRVRTIIKKPLIVVLLILGASVFFYVLNGVVILRSFFSGSSLFFSSHNISLFRELIWRNYAFISLPAIFGLLIAIKRYNSWTIALVGLIFIYAYLWIFKLHSPNIRYLLPLFGLLFVFFGVFWGSIIEIIFQKKKLLITALIILILYAGGYKIVRKPNLYYSPNADFFADVQNADYKTFYKTIKTDFPQFQNYAVFNDWGDTQSWYFPEKKSTAYFRKGNYDINPQQNNSDKIMVYGSLKQFLNEKAKYDNGFLIVEDWESLLPDEIKEYAKKYMKRELRVENLEVSPTDKWPLELYSWGME